MRSLRFTTLALLAVGAAACGGGDTPTGNHDNDVASITVSPSSATIPVGEVKQFTAKALNAKGTQVTGVTFTWSSSNSSVASVGSDGSAHGDAAGTAQITATAAGVTSSAATLVVNSNIFGSYALQSVGGHDLPATVSNSQGTTIFRSGSIVLNEDNTFNATFDTHFTDPQGHQSDASAGSHGSWTYDGATTLNLLVHNDTDNTDTPITATLQNDTISFIDPAAQVEFVFQK